MWIVDWVWYGEHVVFFGGGGDFLPFPRASQNASRLGDFLSTAMCRNSQFTFLSLSLFLFSLSFSLTPFFSLPALPSHPSIH